MVILYLQWYRNLCWSNRIFSWSNLNRCWNLDFCWLNLNCSWWNSEFSRWNPNFLSKNPIFSGTTALSPLCFRLQRRWGGRHPCIHRTRAQGPAAGGHIRAEITCIFSGSLGTLETSWRIYISQIFPKYFTNITIPISRITLRGNIYSSATYLWCVDEQISLQH